MEEKELTLYGKDKIIELVSSMLKYYDKSEYKKEAIKAAYLLMDKVRYCDEDNITLEPDFIEEILFVVNEDGTKSIVREVFGYLRSLGADLKHVSFYNVHISGYYFNGLKNVEINIQKIPNSNISNTFLEGVTVKGTLDGANIEGTIFIDYIGNLFLNPQLVQNKSLYETYINGLTVKGSFDGVNIKNMHTEGFKGEIFINPQKVPEKDLRFIDFNGIHLVGDYDEKTGTYSDPCFDGCQLYETKFKGCIGNVVIPLDKIGWSAPLCDFTGVKLTGKINNTEDISLKYSYYEDENGKKIYLTNNSDYIEGPEDDKIDSHKTRTKKPIFMKRIFGNCKK